MKVEKLAEELSDLELKFDYLKDNMSIYQQNINNNISWFYTVIGIIVTILLVALYFLVKNAVINGVEKAIESTNRKMDIQLDKIKEEFKNSINQSINPTLLNGWSSDPEDTVNFRKDYFGIVHLNGVITDGVYTDGTTLFVLPAGFRPSSNKTFGVLTKSESGGRQFGEIIIETTGEVKVRGALKSVILNGIYFFTE